MAKELTKTYEFKSVEPRIYEMWDKGGYFEPSNDPRKPGFDPDKKPFVISIPPPNVTGELHLGHPMFVSMEDLMIRHARMKGLPTLWVPGTDHAGIATQLKVEKMLEKEGLKREELGRQEFLRRTWEWKNKYGGLITQQIKRLGASCDWSRERFTLDEGLSQAVREAFVRLFEKGLIYRGKRLINWAPLLKTAVSDLEVEYSEEAGFLYYFKYMLAGSREEYIPVATTRPETILGDTAVAVHPDDPRYQKFIGCKAVVPITNREIPVIADEYVDRDFGTGALKITPAHDPNDYAIGQRHNLDFISMLDQTARVNENGGPYSGMDRFECRIRLWADMKAAGLVIKEVPYTLKVPRSQRGGEIVEPMVSTQWFIKIKPLAEAALQAVQDGHIKIVPEHFSKVYYNWMENIQDWCISRQLWWGHRIPVWYCDACEKMTVSREDISECAHCRSTSIRQDEDVLDTWFSSGLWPFSTLGWPDNTPDLQYFYPTSVMETGYDILFFWVARMIMFGLEFTGKAPFHTVYLHGLIRDEKGQKMSKSKDNSIDPLIIMDKYGTDALRFSMLVGSAPGSDMFIDEKKVESNRNFANKLWNAGRFVINAIENAPQKALAEPLWSLADTWIIARLNHLVRDVERLFSNHQYGEAGRQIYEFFWSEFADWYLEISKLQLAKQGDMAYYTASTLAHVMDTSLRLLHPFTPFVTEELWSHLKQAAIQKGIKPLDQEKNWEEALIIASWPVSREYQAWENVSVQKFNVIMDIIRALRNLRADKKVTPGKKIPAILAAGSMFDTVLQESETICSLAHLDREKLQIFASLATPPSEAASAMCQGVQVFLPLADMIDREAEMSKMRKELEEINSQIGRVEKLLAGEFAQKAPPALVEKEKERLKTYQESALKIRNQLK